MDKILNHKVVVTNAPAEYDYGRTLPGAPFNTVEPLLREDDLYILARANGDIRAVLVPADDTYQVDRYLSGLYVAITVQA